MNNMKRMVWVAVAMLIMIGIMGFGLHSLNRITEVNKERREKDKGEAIVVKVLQTTAATDIWDKLRAKQDAEQAEQSANQATENANQENSSQLDENGNPVVVQDDDAENADAPIVNDENDYQDSPQEDFTTVAVPVAD